MPFDELCEEEKERFEAAEKIRLEEERQEAERQAAELEQKRYKLYSGMAEGLLYETIVLCLPHTNDSETGCPMLQELDQIWSSKQLYVSNQQKVMVTPEIAAEVIKFCR